MKKLFIFAAVLTLIAYTGCGASNESATMSADYAVMENAAPALNADDAAGALEERADRLDDIAAEAPKAVYDMDVFDDGDAAYDDADYAEYDFSADADIVSFDADAVVEGAKTALTAVSSADEFNGAPVAEELADDADDIVIEPEPADDEIYDSEIKPAVGLLTAGEWKDHDNWGFFSNLVNSGIIEFPSFGLDPTQRIAVTVTNADGTPLPNAEIALEDDTQTIWKSVTDKNGKAYVFEMDGKTGTKITASQGEITQMIEIESALTDEQGNVQTSDRQTEIILDTEQKLYPNTQIMFIVDTTGSMGDEMLFLQSDFSAITEEVGDENTLYALNFYKDEGDVYVTDFSGFTSDTSAIKSKLNAESASGGGDEPEAVYEALKESIFDSGWNEESVKIAFLIYDAPPHDDKEFQSIIEEASAKGIHLIPVVSSNGSRETELFGRALAICTNSSYVFLTDDSGIGGSHLEPIIGDYEVESLHDIIVRIINDYKQ